MSGLGPLYALLSATGMLLGALSGHKWGLQNGSPILSTLGGAVVGSVLAGVHLLLLDICTTKMRQVTERLRPSHRLLADIVMWSSFVIAEVLLIYPCFLGLRLAAWSLK
jgi:hypothetical protein